MNISIDDLGIEYQDSGKWRSYSLESNGNTLIELQNNAAISETDQDGGEIKTYNLLEAGSEVFIKCMSIIESEFTKECTECGDPSCKRCDCKKCQNYNKKQCEENGVKYI